jgi:diguanylate cyclase (GGDEF)-like protein/PAS domain S-box-containing protein
MHVPLERETREEVTRLSDLKSGPPPADLSRRPPMPLRHAPTTDDDWSRLLGAAAEATTQGLLVIDASGTIRASNQAARTLADLAAFVPAAEQPGPRAIATGAAVLDQRVRFLRRSGEEQWLRVDAVPLFAPGDEQPYGAVVSLSDITTVLAREGELALLATHAGDLIARHAPDGRIVYAAGGAEALLGFDPAQLVGFWAADVCHPDDDAAVRASHEQALRGESGVVSYRLTNALDGREMWLESTVSPVLDEHGAFVEAVTTTRDITTRKANELRLQETEEEARRQRVLLEEAQSVAGLGSWSTDLQTGAESWSPGLFRIFGVDPETTTPGQASHAALVHPDDRDAVRDVLARATRDGAPFDITYRLLRPDGAERTMHGRGAPAERVDGEPRRVWGTTQDVTERHRLEAGRREAERRFRAAFEHAPIGVCVLDFHGPDPGQWVTVNPALADLLGYERETLLRHRISEILHPQELDVTRERLTALVTGKVERVTAECQMVHADGHLVWTLVTVAAVPDEAGRPAYGIGQIVDITERKRFEGQLQYLADHDALTGLFNRRRFEEELDRALAGAERYRHRGAILVLDLDGFKYVNDTLGHPVGDELIARLAGTLRDELRESDVIARLGGDEFGVILPQASDAEAAAVATKLLQAVERDGVVADSTGHARVTASVGLAAFDGADGLSAEELLVEADIAMYDAKEAGRNRAATADHEAGAGRHVSRRSWLERIRSALAEDRFELHAQPIVALGGADEPPAFELLIRMRSDSGELVPPATFLPIAERFDLIGDIDRWVVGRAVALLRREHAAGRPVTLSVNLSGRTLADAGFASWLEALLIATPVPPRRLVVEITETAAIVNLDRARALAETLRRLGCLLALDDFGAGFASFSYLKHLRFDLLKIDGELVRGLRENRTDRLVIEAVVAIARGLGTPALAEFVTDADTLDAVRALGVDYAQGFHLGRPLAVDEALALTRSGAGQPS